MAKIIDHKTVWYQEVASRDYYNENDLERTIMLYMKVIFPEFIVFPFKQDLVDYITKRTSAADLGMVKDDYSEWYVIEVELGKHTKAEVVKQIEVFRGFVPSKEHSDYIFKKRPKELDSKKLETLITTRLPELMVIVNEYKEDWKKDLAKLSCKMCVFQIYNDFYGNRMYRLNGEHPIIATDFCNCRYEKELPYTVKVLNAEFLSSYNIHAGDTFTIEFNGVNYTWQREDAGNEVYLICNNRVSPLDPLSSRYRLNFNSRTVKMSKIEKVRLKLLNRFTKNKVVRNPNTFSFVKD